jgi:uroporphyrinogen-III synthase
MKQSPLLRWIEAAEAHSVCLLAEEDPAQATINPTSTSAHSFNTLLTSLREQLCVGEATRRRLSRFGGIRPAD